MFNGKDYARRLDGAFFIWWNGLDRWTLSVELGSMGVSWWGRVVPLIVGPYSPYGNATGMATVALGEH